LYAADGLISTVFKENFSEKLLETGSCQRFVNPTGVITDKPNRALPTAGLE